MPPEIPTGGNIYCGPFAIACAIGDMTTDESARFILQRRRRRGVRRSHPKGRRVAGVSQGELLNVLREKLGMPNTHPTFIAQESMSLGQWLDRYETAFGNAIVIVRITGHYVCVWRGMVADNRVRKWVDGREWKGRRSRVKQWTVVKDTIACHRAAKRKPVLTEPDIVEGGLHENVEVTFGCHCEVCQP